VPPAPAPSHKASGDPVCAAWQGAGLTGTALLYSGGTELRCGEPLALSAVLVDSHGAPLAGRVLTFTLGSQSIQGTTDASGSASASLTPSATPSNKLTIAYAGDATTSASQTSASLLLESGTRLVGLGPSTLGTGADQPVYVTLEGAADGKPIPGRSVTFILGDVSVTGTTGGDGVARAALKVPSDKAAPRPGLTLSAAYGGDKCAKPASESINVTISGRTSSLPDAGPSASPADSGRTTASSPPALTVTLSALPLVAPGEALSYTLAVRNPGGSVISTASAAVALPGGAKSTASLGPIPAGGVGSTNLSWTAASLTAQGADEPNDSYQARLRGIDGTAENASAIVTWTDSSGKNQSPVIASTSTTQRIPILAFTQGELQGILPGGSAKLPLLVRNVGSAATPSVELAITDADGKVSTATTFVLAAGASSQVPLTTTAPKIAPRRADESDETYLQRLSDTKNHPLAFNWSATWLDCLGTSYGPSHGSASASVLVPVISTTLSGPATVEPGLKVSIVVTAANQGNVTAEGVTADVQFGGMKQTVNIGGVGAGSSLPGTATFTVPSPQSRGADETDGAYEGRLKAADGTSMAVTSVTTWRDSNGNTYGPVHASMTARQQVPILRISSGRLAGLSPGESQDLPFTVQNIGSADAYDARLILANPDGTSSSPEPFDVASGKQVEVRAHATAPALPPKQSGESDAAWVARLRAAGKLSLQFSAELGWNDDPDAVFGPQHSVVQTTVQVPTPRPRGGE
jgi:hypothetical protein